MQHAYFVKIVTVPFLFFETIHVFSVFFPHLSHSCVSTNCFYNDTPEQTVFEVSYRWNILITTRHTSEQYACSTACFNSRSMFLLKYLPPAQEAEFISCPHCAASGFCEFYLSLFIFVLCLLFLSILNKLFWLLLPFYYLICPALYSSCQHRKSNTTSK